MTATHGRGDYHAAVMAWRWSPTGLAARNVAHRLPAGSTPSWVAVVPPIEARPEWIPLEALSYALSDGDVCYVW